MMDTHWISPSFHVALTGVFLVCLIGGLLGLARRALAAKHTRPVHARLLYRFYRKRCIGHATRARRDLLGLTVIVFVVTILFQLFDLDRTIQRWFYVPELLPKAWPLKYQAPWWFLYERLALFMTLLSLGLVGLLIAAYLKPTLRPLRIYLLYGVLVLVIGPGILANFVLKENWGRPRPDQITDFGGRWDYHDVFEPGTPGKGKSFPCGHATVGFSLMAGYLVFRQSRPRLGRWMLWTGLFFGTLLGISRMVGGAHFATDVLWSGYLIYLVSWVLYYPVMTIPYRETSPNPDLMAPSSRWLAISLIAAAGFAISSLLVTPFYCELHREGHRYGLAHPDHLDLKIARGEVRLIFQEKNEFFVSGDAEGFGTAHSSYKDSLEATTNDLGEVTLVYRVEAKGLFSELVAKVNVWVPESFSGRLNLVVEAGNVEVVADSDPAGQVSLTLHEGNCVLPAAWRTSDQLTLQLEHGDVRYAGEDLPASQPASSAF
ncbi:MAG: phosphatase PAP2 family protein [Verrucomicrobia bacterium]|nr:phosphatase PAP2 family protein [Verrucomicrobiota bacterium]